MKNTHLNIHRNFILTPIKDILNVAVSASAGVGNGIETFPLYDYIMQTLFLKMTGFQEQKLKCICWEMATVDFEYRYTYNTKPLGERSAYGDKQILYKELIELIIKRKSDFNATNHIDKKQILKNTKTTIKQIFSNSNLSIWSQKSYNEFLVILGKIEKKHFANDNTNLFTAINGDGICLQEVYTDYLYKHRNRIAHNTLSYQQNLPTLKTLENPNFKYENYFVWFVTLMLIDEIFMALYNIYLNSFDELI